MKKDYIEIFWSLMGGIFFIFINIFNNHSALQLVIWFSIGFGFGLLLYQLGAKYIMGNIKMKKDDNGPV